MGVQVDIDIASINKRFFDSKMEKAIAQILLDEAEDFTPYLTGATTESGRAHPGYITYDTEYAPRIYNNSFNFNTMFHSRPTDHWLQAAYDEENERILERIQQEVDRR